MYLSPPRRSCKGATVSGTTATVTYVPFTITPNVPFSFTTSFDGSPYTVTLLWMLYSQRYYVQIMDQNNNVIVLRPLIASPGNYNISMTAGYFTTTLIYRESTNNFEISG